jgi:hypothetical protein
MPPGTFVSTNSSAGSSKVTYKFNYTISGGIISTTLVSGSFLQAHSSGPRAGQTATSCSRSSALNRTTYFFTAISAMVPSAVNERPKRSTRSFQIG